MSKLHPLSKCDEVLKHCDELLEKIEIQQSSNEILERIKEKHPEFYKFELIYQDYRVKFSKAYFSGSDWYRGDCFYDWWIQQPLNKEEKTDLVFYIIVSNLLKQYK